MPAPCREAHDEPGGPGEDGVRERGHHAAKEEDLGEVGGRAGGLRNGPAEIEDVLRERETAGNREGEHHPVDGSVEMPARH